MRCASLCCCAARAGRYVLELRHQSAVVALATPVLAVALYMAMDDTVQVRGFVQLHARAHGALAWCALLLCVSRRVCSLRHRVCSSGSRVSYLLAGSAPPVVLCGRPCLARSRASIDFCGPACGGDAGSARHWTGGCSSAASTRRFVGHAKVRRLADRVTVSAVWPLGGALAICLV